MDEGRLGAVRKSQSYNRKCVHVMNEIIKNRKEIYQGFLNREEHITKAKLFSDVIVAKRNVVRNHVLLQCMEGIRESTDRDFHLGAYKGRPIASLTRDIDYLVAQNHPRLRRLRICKKVKENGFKHGILLDPWTMRSKVDDFFQKNAELAPKIDFSKQEELEKTSGDREPHNPLIDDSKFRYRARRPSQAIRDEEIAIATVKSAQVDQSQSTPALNVQTQVNPSQSDSHNGNTQSSLGGANLSRIDESEEDHAHDSLPELPQVNKTNAAKKTGSRSLDKRRQSRRYSRSGSISLGPKGLLPPIKTKQSTGEECR